MNKKFVVSKEELDAFLRLSNESMLSAKSRLEEDFLRGAINDSYYACFYIVKALLLKKGIISKTHKGTEKMFSDNFVKSHKFNEKLGSFYGKLMTERIEATYNALREFDSLEEAKEIYEMSVEFVEGAKNLLKTEK